MRTLILGCATGIGNAGARLLAARGDRLALGDIDGTGVDALAAELGRLRIPRGRRRSAALQAFVEAGAQALGGLDYVWSNVGIQIGGSVEQASPADFDRSFAINVRAHAVVCGAAVPHLRASGGGAICITASNSALLSEPQLAPYAVTKAAALALARQVARDYSSRESASTRSARAGSTRRSTRPRGRTSAAASASWPRFRGSCRWAASARPRRPGSSPASCSRTMPRT